MDELKRKIFEKGEISQELAKQLFDNGGILVLKDFPEGCEFGIDCRSWTVGPKFLGLKMIPPGIHFAYVSVKGAPRIAFFYNFKPKEIILRKWERQKEDLADYVSNEIEIERLRCNIKNIDSNLGAYPYTDYQLWTSLSSYITSFTIDRLSPSNQLGRISSQVELITKEVELEKRLGDPHGISIVDNECRGRIRFTDETGLPLMEEKFGSKIRFTEIPQITVIETSMKKMGIDSSDLFKKLLENLHNDHKEILAEFQFAFIIFLIGQIFDGFAQWKKMLHLFSSCTSAVKSHEKFFNELLMVLHFQMKMIPDDFFEDDRTSNNFVITTLSLMFANIEDILPANSNLRIRALKFKILLENKFRRNLTLASQ